MFLPRVFLRKFQLKPDQPKTKRRKFQSIKYDSDEAVKSALLEILIYLIFLVSTTIVTNTSHHLYMYYFNKTLEKLFITRETQTKFGLEIPFSELATTSDWWSFLEESFLDDIHGEAFTGNGNGTNTTSGKYTKNVNEPHWNRTVLRDNILLGPPRLRQIRVREHTCDIHEAFARYFNSCYSEYSRAMEDRRPVFKSTKYYTMNQLNVIPVRGEIKRYYGAGYVQNLSYDRTTNEKTLQLLKSSKWIDRGTRIIILEFVLYNSNSLIFDNVKILAELPPVGGIITSYQFQALKLHSIWSELNYGIYVAASIFYVMVLFYTYEEFVELLRTGVVEYFKALWNLIDITVLVMAYLSLLYNIIHYRYLCDILKKSKENLNEIQSIDKICFWNLLYIDMMGVCVFLVWIKIFKYISFNKTMLQFSVTLSRCAKDLFGFAVMFFIVFLAYAQLGLLIFGSRHPDFREFGISVITLMRMFLGDFEYQLIEEANHVLGPIYFLTYVLFVFFILLNMFLAIINDTYGVVKNEVNKGRSKLGPYLVKLLRGLFRCKSTNEKTEELEHVGTSQNERVANLHKLQGDNVKNELEAAESSAGSLYPPSSVNTNPESERLRKRVSELIREYFEELPANEHPIIAQNSKEDYDLRRLTNRITLLEEVLEQLVTDMDRILASIESKQRRSKRMTRTT